MKGLLVMIGIGACLAVGGKLLVERYPYYSYAKGLAGEAIFDLYQAPRFSEKLLAPSEAPPEPPLPAEAQGLWRQFQLRDVVVALPTGHPMFRTIPLIERPAEVRPTLGLLFQGPSGRDIARLYLMKSGTWSEELEAQKLFRLPLVRRVILSRDTATIWQDLFARDLRTKPESWQEMVYNLYLLHLRGVFFPPGIEGFGALKQGKGFFELPSQNKDYRTEVVLQNEQGMVLSYVIVTERESVDSQELRGRFLGSIAFRVADPALAAIVYREFKQLSFNRQIDQEGMLYLLSAWSQTFDDQELLKEMIYFLERNPKNVPHLKALYRFGLAHYKRTFTTRAVGLESDSDDVRLQRLIELEEIQNREKLLERPRDRVSAPAPSKAQQLEDNLQRARQEKGADKTKPKSKLIVH